MNEHKWTKEDLDESERVASIMAKKLGITNEPKEKKCEACGGTGRVSCHAQADGDCDWEYCPQKKNLQTHCCRDVELDEGEDFPKCPYCEIKELEKQIKSMECCGNCDDELNQEASRVCEYCIRYEDNGDEGGHYQDNWKQKNKK